MEPPVSLPKANKTSREAIVVAEPPDEPPDIFLGFQGFLGAPK